MEATRTWIKPFFWTAVAYDIVLGIVFFFAFKPVFAAVKYPLPNNDGYMQFPALLIIVFGVAACSLRQRLRATGILLS